MAGGLMGFAKRRSVPSLVAGLAFGAGFAASGVFLAQGRTELGHQTAIGVSCLLAGAMAARLYKTRKASCRVDRRCFGVSKFNVSSPNQPMPAGGVLAVALVTCFYNGQQLALFQQ
jgi:uncharacterized membrane protein (UPF0136 family)